ncbi:MAG TPA: YchE family NAAT transporter [Nitrospirota bacterium]|jgi:multiple antibiotic resistance protein
MIELTVYIKIFTTLLAIVNPLGVIPVFVSLTANATGKKRRQTARTTSLAVALVLIVATLIGQPLLNFFGISIDSFKVGGGILLMLMAVDMMQAKPNQVKQTPEEAEEAIDKESVAVVPVAIPLLSGPGAISTVIIYAQGPFRPVHISMIIVIILLVSMITLAALYVASPISKILSKTGINIATRLMGLLLAAVSVEFIVGGLGHLFPILAK